MPRPVEKLRFLVTGGYGFIGSNVVIELLQRGHRVVVIDDLSTGFEQNLSSVANHPLLTTVIASVNDYARVAECVNGVDVVVHAAVRNIMLSTREPHLDLQTNIAGTLNVLSVARERGAKVIYLSSSSIYGEPAFVPTNEDVPPDLRLPYCVSKYAGEMYCRLYHRMYGLPVVILRLTNTYGRNQRPVNGYYCGVIGRFLFSVLKGNPVRIHGTGEQTRDFIHVSDVVSAILLAAECEEMNGEVYNVGTGIEISLHDLALMCLSFGSFVKGKLDYIAERDYIDVISRRCLDIRKIRQFGWEPGFSLLAGLRNTFEWLKREYSDDK